MIQSGHRPLIKRIRKQFAELQGYKKNRCHGKDKAVVGATPILEPQCGNKIIFISLLSSSPQKNHPGDLGERALAR
jgi:hypothetical protein